MKFLACIILSLFVLGCENNPYPEIGELREEPAAEDRAVELGLALIVESVYEFSEGSRTDFRIKASVPAPGVAEVRIEGLPAGAIFDPKTLIVSWKPGMFDGNNPTDPTIKSRLYPITVWLNSSEDIQQSREKQVVLTVLDKPQNLIISSNSQVSVIEKSTMKFDFRVENADYPKGPFYVTTEGMPSNTSISQVSDNEFQLSFSPDSHHVKINEENDCRWNSRENCLKYKSKIIVHNPANHKTEKALEIKVVDKRLLTTIVTPKNMEQGLDITFQVSAYDMNGEVAPKILMVGDEPEFGEFKTELILNEENNSSVLNITWSDIPPSHNGSHFRFAFKACSLDPARKYTRCVRDATTINIKVKDRSAPIISRSSWDAGVIKYLKYKQRANFQLRISDGDSTWDNVQSVAVSPETMTKYVSWINNRLVVRFDKPGIHQFSIIAKSHYNMTSAESFVAEVFEPNRSRTLYFTDSTRDAEVKFYRDTMGNVQLMNPVLQKLNERNLSGRDTLILGTGILKDETLKPEINRAMAKIKNVLIASPLIRNMPDSFIDELQKEFHISILGRYTELPNTKDISEMHFIQREDFEQTNANVKLKETSTDESFNPLVFSVGVDRVNCEDVLDLTDSAEEARLKIGIICNRKNGGRYAILGTEFSDLKATEEDKSIPAKWLRRMISTSLNSFTGKSTIHKEVTNE